MAEMTFCLPDELADWIEAEAVKSDYADAGGFLLALLRNEYERRKPPMSIDELRARLDASRRSGVSEKSIEEIIADGNRLAKARRSEKHGTFTR
ncbi:MAG: type II toxin-antitoxin system ParD family antitoxin [Ancylobacter novellus]|uniref:Type II toxin-antitoxin system ParD family antitoxin n=1 Tax=Ancylobacter novellus TaxID=921 RepID=A0A2W5KQB4_ANCNO|nr:MAG: type II toxin-antitoxin system ParD family antitoxin [Ancylobacter novellus]